MSEHEEKGDSVELAPGVRAPASSIEFSYVASSGPGGQNVNKRSTKAVLRVRLADLGLRPDAQARLRRLAGRQVTDEGELILTGESTRSQKMNKKECLDRLRLLLIEASRKPKPRRPTKPTTGSVRRRLDAKKQQGEKKQRRQKPDW